MPTTIYVESPFNFEKEVARINKKAARLGVEKVIIRQLGWTDQTRTVVESSEGTDREIRTVVRCMGYEISTPTVQEQGWSFAAVITPTDGKKAFVDSRVENLDVSRYEGNPHKCDHCGTNRHRNLTYVVRHTSGRELQVGRVCLKELIGGLSVSALEFRDYVHLFLSEDDDGFWNEAGSGRSIKLFNVLDCVTVAETMRLVEGAWKNNRKDAFGNMESEGTHRLAAGIVKSYGIARYLGSHPKEYAEAKAKAEEIIEKTRSAEIDDSDEFGQMLAYCCQFDSIPEAKVSAVCYLGQYWVNRQEREDREARKQFMKHVGTVGKREIFRVTVKKVVSFDSTYGIVNVNIMEDADGNVLVWKSGTYGLDEGKTYELRATVKEHSERDGAPQTIITRAKIEEAGLFADNENQRAD